jgi:oxygen-independent coproporphyrinogen-3 oxidase
MVSLLPEVSGSFWPDAAYLHIPFCKQRCYYCDFATGLGTAVLIEQYVQVLCQEIDQIPMESSLLQTIFFGGGTPSLLSASQLERILSHLSARIPFAADIEVSLEANPGTLTRSQLADYKTAGINRISLGVQAFQAKLLALCGRLHGVEEVYQTLEDLAAVGLDNINLDLIFGLPTQTLDQWQESLTALLEIHPPHVSLYDLTIEPGTRFGRLYHPGEQPLPDDTITVEMYLLARSCLTSAGYEHYEISNFAQPGFHCRHNRVYWENRSYYGLGMGAVGYVQGKRIHNPKTLHAYFEQVKSGRIPETPLTTVAEHWMDTLMLGLRLQEGLDLDTLITTFSAAKVADALRKLDPFYQRGWVNWDQGRLKLIPPEGWLFSNTILAELFP